MLWSDLYTAPVSLADANMSLKFKKFKTVHEWWVFVQHGDIVRYFLVIVVFYCAKRNCISYAWLENFGRGR